VTASVPFPACQPDGLLDHVSVLDGDRLAALEGPAELRCQLAAERKLTTQLRAALTSRAAIDQAIGILMAQQRCTAEQAFEILRTASQNRNVKLRHVAADIVTGLTGHPPQPPPFRSPDHPRHDTARP
jgi:hypothetical protein